MAKVAKLVTISLKTRVIVDENDSEEKIIEKARPHFLSQVKDSALVENIETIEDDEEIPYGKGFNDK